MRHLALTAIAGDGLRAANRARSRRYCEGERAALCKQCDQEYHKSNPTLASHARLPIDPITGGDSSGGGRDSPLFAGDAYYAAVPPPSLPQGHGRSEHMQLARQASLTGLDGLYQVAAQPDAVTGDTTLDAAFDYAANADIDILGASGTLDDDLLLLGEAPLVDQSKRQASEFHDWLEALIEEVRIPKMRHTRSFWPRLIDNHTPEIVNSFAPSSHRYVATTMTFLV